jgi:hypothetical protein
LKAYGGVEVVKPRAFSTSDVIQTRVVIFSGVTEEGGGRRLTPVPFINEMYFVNFRKRGISSSSSAHPGMAKLWKKESDFLETTEEGLQTTIN